MSFHNEHWGMSWQRSFMPQSQLIAVWQAGSTSDQLRQMPLTKPCTWWAVQTKWRWTGCKGQREKQHVETTTPSCGSMISCKRWHLDCYAARLPGKQGIIMIAANNSSTPVYSKASWHVKGISIVGLPGQAWFAGSLQGWGAGTDDVNWQHVMRNYR